MFTSGFHIQRRLPADERRDIVLLVIVTSTAAVRAGLVGGLLHPGGPVHAGRRQPAVVQDRVRRVRHGDVHPGHLKDLCRPRAHANQVRQGRGGDSDVPRHRPVDRDRRGHDGAEQRRRPRRRTGWRRRRLSRVHRLLPGGRAPVDRVHHPHRAAVLPRLSRRLPAHRVPGPGRARLLHRRGRRCSER